MQNFYFEGELAVFLLYLSIIILHIFININSV